MSDWLEYLIWLPLVMVVIVGTLNTLDGNGEHPNNEGEGS